MKKVLFAAVLALAGTGCGPSSTPVAFPIIPPEFKDCTFARLTNGWGYTMYVGRCPLSVTTITPTGKGLQPSVTVDGVEYVNKN